MRRRREERATRRTPGVETPGVETPVRTAENFTWPQPSVIGKVALPLIKDGHLNLKVCTRMGIIPMHWLLKWKNI